MSDETFHEFPGIKSREDATEGVIAGAVGHLEVLAQPSLPDLGESLEIINPLHASEHCGQRDEEHFAKIMALGLAITWIG